MYLKFSSRRNNVLQNGIDRQSIPNARDPLACVNVRTIELTWAIAHNPVIKVTRHGL